jgi:hypothetical protein
MGEEAKGFIDFILAAEESMELTQSFLQADTYDKLKAFFAERGYTGVTDGDCAKIAQAVKGLPVDIFGPNDHRTY